MITNVHIMCHRNPKKEVINYVKNMAMFYYYTNLCHLCIGDYAHLLSNIPMFLYVLQN